MKLLKSLFCTLLLCGVLFSTTSCSTSGDEPDFSIKGGTIGIVGEVTADLLTVADVKISFTDMNGSRTENLTSDKNPFNLGLVTITYPSTVTWQLIATIKSDVDYSKSYNLGFKYKSQAGVVYLAGVEAVGEIYEGSFGATSAVGPSQVQAAIDDINTKAFGSYRISKLSTDELFFEKIK